MKSNQSVNDIGEQGLLKKLQSFCPGNIIGDDGAVLSVDSQEQLVITTDVLVDGVHFSDHTTPPETVGWRAAAANLSDLAAMGATPIGITVGLSLPGELKLIWVEKLYQGLTDCLQRYQTPIVGGDICRSPVTTISITAFGTAVPHRIIRRSSAQPGDAILVTGTHGKSYKGLQLLLNPELGKNISQSERNTLIEAHQHPKPRLDVLPLLWEIVETTSVAGIDSSDGLADGVLQICRMSGVGARLERSQIEPPPSLLQWMSPEEALYWTLYGGEDFELVLCLPLELAKKLVKRLRNGAAIIGTITEEPNVILVDNQERYPPQKLTLTQGFQHF
ncbi:thiamine-phosphate kinase [cyanobacterium endosymbiont of Epithemia clementina EcSB]|uniref:thiamine-phosphate kinase n=1 Tax=cyanobacterium endosymbiont of Epithemia clementina EcSB TaxID=3034674 RepID=UPI002480C7EC|nr:thiamine-phosphate kinase [cyanobacterium endosymbiont of Epithemia clementina EcSB]WGT67440.1 thiamine-phosphate kinase [cyanobacterium endosymbiont of Epithemia clementina EcSB]